MDEKIIIGAKYRHYKTGNLYRVLALVKHSETQEDMILYQALYGLSSLWVRPLNMWFDEIPIEKTLLNQNKRFELVEDGE